MLAIGTPGQAPEEGVGVVAVPDDLGTAPGGRLPEPDGIIPSGTGQPAPLRTPCHAVDIPAMAAQHPGWRPPPSSGHIPDGDQRIRAGTRHLRAVWTPGEVVEGGHRALHDPHTLPT